MWEIIITILHAMPKSRKLQCWSMPVRLYCSSFQLMKWAASSTVLQLMHQNCIQRFSIADYTWRPMPLFECELILLVQPFRMAETKQLQRAFQIRCEPSLQIVCCTSLFSVIRNCTRSVKLARSSCCLIWYHGLKPVWFMIMVFPSYASFLD